MRNLGSIYLTEHFSLYEMCDSFKAEELNLKNIPEWDVLVNLNRLCLRLEIIRSRIGLPIIVNSGYRSPALNKAVKGAANSQHVSGQAADITSGSKFGNKRMFILAQKLDLPFDQLIDEKNYSWIHVSYSPRNRKQILHL